MLCHWNICKTSFISWIIQSINQSIQFYTLSSNSQPEVIRSSLQSPSEKKQLIPAERHQEPDPGETRVEIFPTVFWFAWESGVAHLLGHMTQPTHPYRWFRMKTSRSFQKISLVLQLICRWFFFFFPFLWKALLWHEFIFRWDRLPAVGAFK